MVFWQKLKAIYNNHRLAVITCCLGLLLYYLPFVIMGEDSYIRVHDNLDSEILFNTLVLKYFWQFSGTVPSLANIDIGSINTFSYFQLIFYAFLPPFGAYMANDFAVRLTGFVGMYIFLNLFSQKLVQTTCKPINAAVALLFALLPVYTVYGLTSLGLPLLVLAFYWIDRKVRLPLAYALVAYYTLSSSVVLSGYFVLIVLFVMCCRRFFAKGRWRHIHFYAASFMVFALYLIMYAKVIHLVGFTDFVSHRAIWGTHKTYNQIDNIGKFIEQTASYFVYGHYHGGSAHAVAIGVTVIVFIIALIVRKRNPDLLDNRLFAIVGWSIALTAAISLLCSLLSITLFVYLTTFLGPLESFNFGRLFHIMPLSVYAGFAFACLLGVQMLGKFQPQRLTRRAALVGMVVVCLSSMVFASAFHPFDSSTYGANYPLLFGSRLQNRPTYREMFDTKLFAEINHTINRPKSSYRVASLGISPAAASVNGFYTVDGYMQNYSLDYWERFRLAIAPELDKDTELDDYYLWGNRCYLFAADIGKEYYLRKDSGLTASVDYDLVALRALGCEYIFSAVEITNADQLGLQLIGTFEHSKSYWRIRVYQLP